MKFERTGNPNKSLGIGQYRIREIDINLPPDVAKFLNAVNMSQQDFVNIYKKTYMEELKKFNKTI